MTIDDELEIPSGGAVFTFGRSRFADNAPSKFWIKNDEIADIACGDQHTAVLTGNGRVFTIGSNDQGQLGLNSLTPVVKPSCVKDTGCVYSWGHNDEGQLGTGNTEDRTTPQLVLSLPAPPVAVAAGSAHSVLLTGAGEVFVWGSNSCGQLGLQTDVQTSPAPLSLTCAVRQVTCGYYHTLLVTEDKSVLSFGEATNGKLGRDPAHEPHVPHLVPDLSQRVSQAAAGANHSLLLTETGVVLSCGCSGAGQLGQGPGVNFSPNFAPIVAPDDVTFVAIAAGHSHSAALTSGGQVYVWGCGRHDKLGFGEQKTGPVFIPAPLPRLRHLTAALVGCGGCHTMVLGYPPSTITPPHLHKNSTMLPPLRGGSALPPLTPAVPPIPEVPPHQVALLVRILTLTRWHCWYVYSPSPGGTHVGTSNSPADPPKTIPDPTIQAHAIQDPAIPAHAIQDPAIPAHAIQDPAIPAHAIQDPAIPAHAIQDPAIPVPVSRPDTAGPAVRNRTDAQKNFEKNIKQESKEEEEEGEEEEGDDEEEQDGSDNTKQGKKGEKGNPLVRLLSHWSRRKTSTSPPDDPPEPGLLDPQVPQAPASTPVPHMVRPATDGGADEDLDLLDADEQSPSAPTAAEVTQASLQLPPDDDKSHGGIVYRLRALRKVNNITDGQLEETHLPHQLQEHPQYQGQVTGSPAHVDTVQSKACTLL
ncbi:Regulator of chromosome condensation RCC1 [Trinorchestia longiramus]|nr:Regulator of chromosome condensation RCC1 [Trinorchestia longiramus]